MSTHRRALECWLKDKSVKGSVLDVGGNVWSAREKMKSCGRSYKTLAEKDADINFNLEDTAIGHIPYRTFDAVLCLEVMQFVIDPCRVMENFQWIMKSDGVLLISFHQSHPPMKGHDYLRYTEKGVRELLQRYEFEITEFEEPIEGYYLISAKCPHSQ